MAINPVFEVDFQNWQESVDKILSAADFAEIIAGSGKETVLIKPNLVSNDPPPITTPVQLVAAIIIGLRKIIPDVKIKVGEGTGIKELGYALD